MARFPRCLGLAVTLLALGRVALAQDRFIEDIQVSRTGNEATILIQLGCPMRYVSDIATQDGIMLEVRLAPLDACRSLGLGNGIASELYRPPSGRLANLTEVEYESLGLGDNLLTLRFDGPPSYRLTQRGDLRSLELTVTVAGGAAPAPAEQAPPVTEPPPAPPPGASGPPQQPEQSAPAERAPLTVHTVEPEAPRDYVINLRSTREPIDPESLAGLSLPGKTVYVSDIELSRAVWHRLRIGFFASEEEAREQLATLSERFPSAWVGHAEPAEIAAAEGRPLAVVAAEAPGSAPGTGPVVATPSGTEAITPGAESAAAERAATLLEQARAAMLAQDYPEAIRLYTGALQIPGDHRQEAREYLGLARERNHQLAHARAEYQAYLQEYPQGEGAARVRQRLAGLLAATEQPRAPLRAADRSEGGSSWDIFSGISQYYRRDVNIFNEDTDPLVTQSALLSDIDLNVRRRGTSLDVLGRVTATHIYDLMRDGDASSRGNDTRVSYAYVDVDDQQRQWSARIGRQLLHTGGVLGRFDGLYASYEWASDRVLHFTTGYPVESTRNGVETGRQFYGVSVDFNNVWSNLDLTAFVNQQTIGSLQDRQAIGGEARYADERRSLVGLIDYDTSYSELTAAVLLGSWRFENRMVANLLLDERKSPVLTTRNALIGQSVSDIEELMLLYNEDEIRRLARDRTASTHTVTVGISSPFAQRFQVNADVTTTQTDATEASGNVAAIPGTGSQTYYSLSFIGSGLFKTGDVTIFGYRRSESDTYATDLLTLDMRLPVGRQLRINPRLRIALRENLLDSSTQTTVAPSFRLLLNAKRRYRLELELGRDWTQRDLGTGSLQDSGAYFFNLGYRVDF
jgi:tetratricopeptide (TPR) repeat protein